MILLTLPFPVSVNAMYKNIRKGRAKSQRYMTWARSAGWSIKEQKPEPIKGWYTLTLVLHEKDKRRRDPDNFVKAVSDLLVTHNLIDDDCMCADLQVHRQYSDEAKVEVIVRPSNGIVDRRAA